MRYEKGQWPAVNVKSVLASVERVFKTRDSSRLTKVAYNRLYLLGGFIAHYDLGGFQHAYSNTSQLARDILSAYEVNNPDHYMQECFVRDYGQAYCQSEHDLARNLKTCAAHYLPELEKHDNDSERESDIAYARALLAKHEVVA